MTDKEFSAKVYEILSPGLFEHKGKQYYTEESVMNAMDWMRSHLGETVEADVANVLAEALKKAFSPYR
jgi:hypothetical protein